MDHPPALRHGQRGVAAMLTTLLLFLGIALILIYTNRGAIIEQRLAGGDVRGRQAFAAANAGVDHALAYMQDGGIDHDDDGTADTISSLTLTNSGTGVSTVPSYYVARYCVAGSEAGAICSSGHTTGITGSCGAVTGSHVAVVSCGWSDDDSSVQRVVQVLRGTASTAGVVAAPLVARGTANLLTGGASIFNYFNDLTVWSGGSLLGQSNTGKTFTRDIGDPQHGFVDPDFEYRVPENSSPGCNSAPAGYACSTQGSSFGHDTIFGDSTLANATSDAFFRRFLGQSPTSYRDSVATWVVDAPGGTTVSGADSGDVGSVAGKNGQVVWVEGDLTLPSLGSQTEPSILVVNGDLNLQGSPVVNGLIYVTGQVTGSGTPTIYGAMIAAGGATANGNIKIVYDPEALAMVENIGKAARVPGGFRDW